MIEPRNHTPRNPARPTAGPALAKVAAAKGRRLMPWQQRAADVALELEVDDTGQLVPWYRTVVITVPRQAGKTTLISDIADWRCLTTPNGRAWITMQRGKDASAWMRDEHLPRLATSAFRGHYHESRRAGSEGPEWPNGATFRAFAPSRDGLHSKQSDLVILDEAWAFDMDRGAELRQAIRPTMLTRRGPQLFVVSTRGDDDSTFLDSYIDLGMASIGDPTSRVCFIDYGIPDDADPNDLDAIVAHHPANGHTVDRDALEAARADFVVDGVFDSAGYGRAYGNRATRTRVSAFPGGQWADAARPRPEVPTRVGLALDVTPDGERLAVAAAWHDDTAGWVELLYADRIGPDAAGIVAALHARAGAPVLYDPSSPATLDVVESITRAHPRVELVPVKGAEMTSACAVFARGIRTGTVHHTGQRDLTAATEVATRRASRDGGFVWSRRSSSGSIAELVAATLALRAADTLPPPKPRPIARGASARHA